MHKTILPTRIILAICLAACVQMNAVHGQPPFGGGGDRRGDGRHPDGRHPEGRRGGFDASSFLDRLDRNGNGMLDPDEQEGPGQFLIQRLQSVNPKFASGKPISIKKIKSAFEKMRRGGDGKDGDRRRGERDSSDPDRRMSRSNDDEALTAKLLVPGFGNGESAPSLMGFGASAELLDANITESDRAEAAKTMATFDRDKDGFIRKDELSSRWAGSPMDFDRNRDDRLSIDELSVRYAVRREAKSDSKKNRTKNGFKDRKSGRGSEAPDVFNGRNSYRSTNSRAAPEGLPGFFSDRDGNGDGQVSMAEFAAKDDWTDDLVNEFLDSDFNQDGVITAAEALRSVEDGPASKLRAAANDKSPTNGKLDRGSANSDAKSPLTGQINKKYLDLAKRIIGRRDANKDGVLTASEWKTMLMSPVAADANRDGKITPEEYAHWTMSRGRN